MDLRYEFGRDRRLRARREFLLVFDRGTRERARGFTAIVLPTERPRSRLGVSVGKRYGNAVRRNRIKRMLREAFRLEQHEIPDGLDVVIVPRRELHSEGLASIRTSLRRAVNRAARRATRRAEP